MKTDMNEKNVKYQSKFKLICFLFSDLMLSFPLFFLSSQDRNSYTKYQHFGLNEDIYFHHTFNMRYFFFVNLNASILKYVKDYKVY